MKSKGKILNSGELSRCLCILLASSLMMLSTTGIAQQQDEDEVDRGLQRRPGVEQERPDLPDFVPEEDVPLALPELDSFDLPPADTLASMPSVYLQNVVLANSSVIDPEKIGRVSERYLQKNVTADDLQSLRFELTQLYLEEGYITSGVLLPDQRIADGTVSFQAVEGTLEDVAVETDGRLRSNYVANRLVLEPDEPLNVADLQDALRELHNDPLVRRLTSRLVPGSRRGLARLLVDVEEAKPYSFNLRAANDRAPSVGSEWIEASFKHLNLLGFGDRLYARYGTADGLDDFGVTYAFPITARGMTLGFTYENSDSQVIEEPFNRIDIASDSENYALDLVVPWYKDRYRSLTFTGSLENRRSFTSLLGIPFSFSPGVQQGRSEVTVARITADWVDRRSDRVLALRGRISRGIDVLDPTINAGVLPDSEFTTFLFQGQWAKRFTDWGHQLILRGDLQKTLDGLLPMEKFSLGGMHSVRGYRQNLMVRDNGWLASAEYRIPAFQDEFGNAKFQWAFFADVGRGWNEDFATPQPKSISSVGVGALWDPTRNLQMKLYLAHALDDVEFLDEDLQDEGVHFSLTYRLF